MLFVLLLSLLSFLLFVLLLLLCIHVLPAHQGEHFLCERCYQVTVQSAQAIAAATPTVAASTGSPVKPEHMKYGKCNMVGRGVLLLAVVAYSTVHVDIPSQNCRPGRYTCRD